MGCLPEKNFFGLPLALYMMKVHPVLHLTPQEELQFVTHAEDSTLQQFFADAASPELEAQRRAVETAREKLSESK